MAGNFSWRGRFPTQPLIPANESNQHRRKLAFVYCRVEPARNITLLEVVPRVAFGTWPKAALESQSTVRFIVKGIEDDIESMPAPESGRT